MIDSSYLLYLYTIWIFMSKYFYKQENKDVLL